MKEIANFFWDGEMTKLEKACIKSFIDHNFDVKLWSYTGLGLDSAESCDANLIVDKQLINHLDQSFRQGELQKARVTAFSDLFRYNLVSKFNGWWFDADCYCLKDESYYKELRKDKKVTSAFIEKGQTVAVGAFYIDKDLANVLLEDFQSFIESNKQGEWGVFGPDFFTNFVQKHDLVDDILFKKVFYEIHWSEFHYFTNPELVTTSKQRLKDSYLTHIWNTEFSLRYLDKNNPSKGSLLDELYTNLEQ